MWDIKCYNLFCVFFEIEEYQDFIVEFDNGNQSIGEIYDGVKFFWILYGFFDDRQISL